MDVTKLKTKEIKNELERIKNTSGFVILKHFWNIQREEIIKKGKSMRSEENKIKMWAELDGFDKAVSIIDRLINAGKIIENNMEVEDAE